MSYTKVDAFYLRIIGVCFFFLGMITVADVCMFSVGAFSGCFINI
jgi:hypothetical protein